jgi:2OG-Fe(II) oxygenase superfamily
MTAIYVQANVVNCDICSHLVSAYNLCAPYARYWDQHHNPIINWSDPNLDCKTSHILLVAIKQCHRITSDCHQQENLYIETAILALLRQDQGHEAHADNETFTNNIWAANHTPNRHYASILYLNSDFEGGELSFLESSLLIKPETGLFVTFPCHHDFVHEVIPVSLGHRYSLAVWFTCHKQYANIQLSYILDKLSLSEYTL